MKNQLTFAHVTGALLDNKMKTYPQHRLVHDLFSLCLSDEASDYDEATEDNITFSRWCNGARPVPVDILNEYKDETGRNQMITDFTNKIIPNLVNVPNARHLLEEIINSSRKTIVDAKADAFFKEFVKNDFQLLITTRCEIKQFATLEIKEIASEKELLQLFASHCPYSEDATETIKQIIKEVHSHTLTVVLSALSLAASGLEPDELLHELQTCGLNITDSEDMELHKDGDYHDGPMIEHLRIFMQISRLNQPQTDILQNLSVLPVSDVYKNHFKNWLQLTSLRDVNYLARYGFITDGIENKKIYLHPLIQEIIYKELKPCISNCQMLVNSLHTICLSSRC